MPTALRSVHHISASGSARPSVGTVPRPTQPSSEDGEGGFVMSVAEAARSQKHSSLLTGSLQEQRLGFGGGVFVRQIQIDAELSNCTTV